MPQVAQLFATLSLTRQTLILLVEKRQITPEEAAEVFMRSAAEVRTATKDELSPQHGEAIAQCMAVHAGWFLSYRQKGSEVSRALAEWERDRE
jgi:hypothetical protein